MAEDLVPIVQLYTTTFNYDTNAHETRLGMFSHKILILTGFGLNHFKQKFIKKKLYFSAKKSPVAFGQFGICL